MVRLFFGANGQRLAGQDGECAAILAKPNDLLGDTVGIFAIKPVA
jgi:hypothetical protein